VNWEELVGERLRRIGLGSVRRKILGFALLAVLIPSLSTAWISYVQNRRSLTAKVAEGLARASAQTRRELDLWIRDRLYDAKVYSGSYEVTENLGVSGQTGRARGRLQDYLASVRTRSVDFAELQVATLEGTVLASSAATATRLRLPDTWLGDVRQDKPVIGTPYWDADVTEPVVPIAVAVMSGDGRVLGALSAKVTFGTVDSLLRGAAPAPRGALFILDASYGVITGTPGVSAELMQTRIDAPIARDMLARRPQPATFRSPQQGVTVVGTIEPVERLNWFVVAELPEREAFAQIRHLRNVTVVTVLSLLIVVGLLGYVLGQLIIRPLDRLTQGAAQVAGGNLDVDLRAVGGGELGRLVNVFNDMVDRLRANRAELERLAITDALTGLYNRRHLMVMLAQETSRARRHKTPLGILLIDVDHFKHYNDTFGHQPGDDVLVRLMVVLTHSVRDMDVTARYGGEEFVILLPETQVDGAMKVAERIRSATESEFSGPDEPRQVTVSIGVAAYPADGETPETLLASADAAMYRAKEGGRNRVERAARRKRPPLTPPSAAAR
jgi:diguanylate cyclase (GGDEF)-like protein